MAGRIWARTGCDFSDAARPGAVTCLTGGCEGGMECTAYGKPPCESPSTGSYAFFPLTVGSIL